MPQDGTHYLDVEKIIRETEAAWLVTLDEYEGEHWLPKSQVHNGDQFKVGDKNCTFEIPAWLAEDRGFE